MQLDMSVHIVGELAFEVRDVLAGLALVLSVLVADRRL